MYTSGSPAVSAVTAHDTTDSKVELPLKSYTMEKTTNLFGLERQNNNTNSSC